MPLPNENSCYPGTISKLTAEENGSYTFLIAVNDVVDHSDYRARELDLGALDFESYLRNPVVAYNHRTWGDALPIGKTNKICVGPEGIEANMTFAETDFAKEVKELVEGDFLRSASISWTQREGHAPELIEWSIVVLPADKDAVRYLQDSSYIDGIQETVQTNSQTIDNMSEPTKNNRCNSSRNQDDDAALRVDMEKENARLKTKLEKAEAKISTLEEKIKAYKEKERATNLEVLKVRYADLLPDDKEYETEEDLLTAAAGDFAKDSDGSVGYLRAMADIVLKQRKEAPSAPGRSGESDQTVDPQVADQVPHVARPRMSRSVFNI